MDYLENLSRGPGDLPQYLNPVSVTDESRLKNSKKKWRHLASMNSLIFPIISSPGNSAYDFERLQARGLPRLLILEFYLACNLL